MTAPFFVAFPFWGCHAERSEASPSKREYNLHRFE